MQNFARKDSILTNILLFMSETDRSNNDALKVVKFVIDKVALDVANYCNLESLTDIPERLDGTITALVVQYLDTNACLPSDKTSNLQSMTEGDVTYNYKDTAKAYQDIQAANTITSNYIATLNKFRKLPPQ